MEHFLLFDSLCPKCARIAQKVEESSRGRIRARSLRDPEVQVMLDLAMASWEWRPTLVQFYSKESVKLLTGFDLALGVLRLLGIKQASKIAALMWREGLPSFPLFNRGNCVSDKEEVPRNRKLSRRQVLVAALAATLSFLPLIRGTEGNTALADTFGGGSCLHCQFQMHCDPCGGCLYGNGNYQHYRQRCCDPCYGYWGLLYTTCDYCEYCMSDSLYPSVEPACSTCP